MSVLAAPVGREARGADGATLCAIFVVVLILVPARQVIGGLPFDLTYAEAVGLFAAVWWCCAHLTSTLGAAKGPNLVRYAVYFYVITYLVTYAYTTAGFLPAHELALSDHVLVITVGVVGMALLAVDGVSGHDRLDLVLKTLVVAGAVMGAIGGLQFLLSFDLTQYLQMPGSRLRSMEETILQRNGVNRVASTATHPIEFGVVSAMVLPLALHYAFDAWERGAPALRWWILCALVACGMAFSASRSTVLGLAVSGLILLAGWNRARRLRAGAGLLGFLVLLRLFVPGLLGAIMGLFGNLDNDESLRWRTNDYTSALTEFAQHPWLGRGHGTWFPPHHPVFDNQYLLTAVQGGVFGLLGFVGLFVIGILAALRARRIAPDPRTKDLGLSLAAALAVPLVGCATFDLNSFTTANSLAFLLIGLAGALLRLVNRDVTAQAGAAPPSTSRRPGLWR
ncbi:O-antigen ligase family protein [Nonomuraea candida]|uniref:O-antigen ligase family protein n=1 Tax=Nonomuraea candida TaxID=359159 RepID=UPI00069435B4|nr:O-antigen ligase family protein [Nonomuraea candida]